jgi:hypothetical protein
MSLQVFRVQTYCLFQFGYSGVGIAGDEQGPAQLKVSFFVRRLQADRFSQHLYGFRYPASETVKHAQRHTGAGIRRLHFHGLLDSLYLRVNVTGHKSCSLII